MKKLIVLVCVFVVVSVTAVQAEELYETFGSDPLTRGWTKVENAQNTFTYMNGYLKADLAGSSTLDMDKYTTSLGSYNQTKEFWMEMDILHTSTYGLAQQGQFGVLNGTGTDNTHNFIGDRMFFAISGTSSGQRGNRHDVYAFTSTGASDKMDSTNLGDSQYVPQIWLTSWNGTDTPESKAAASFRVKFHYFWDTDGKAEMAIYKINADGTTGDLKYRSATAGTLATPDTVVASTATLNFNAFGLLGRKDYNGTTQESWIDNMYFSTEGTNPVGTVPSWIPEPATVALLSLGALILRRRK